MLILQSYSINIKLYTRGKYGKIIQNIFSGLEYGGTHLKENQNASKSKLLITQQEMVLIKNSAEAQNINIYGNLYDCLSLYKKLSQADLERNIVFDDRARAVILNRDNKKVLMDNISKEWYSISNYNISDSEMHCQLCGHRNKIICYIKNRITGVELHIGSECVKNYSNIDGLKQEMKRISNAIQEREMQKRKIEFEILEENDTDFLQKATEILDKFPVMLPYRLCKELNDTLEQLKLAKNTYIKSGGNLEQIFSTFSLLKIQFTSLYNKAEKHYEKVKDSILVCDRDTAKWLINNNSLIFEHVAKNNGLFNVDTLKKVYYQNFIRARLKVFIKHLADTDIKIIDITEKVIRFSIQNERYMNTITFTMPINKFMEKIGCYCLTDQTFIYDKRTIQDIAIEPTINNFGVLYNSVSNILNEKGYDFIIEEKSLQAYWKKLPYYEKKTKWSNNNQIAAMFKESNIEYFLAVFSQFLLKDESVLIKNFDYIVKKMECGKRWMTQKEKNYHEQIIREARGYQKQREFIPY